MSHHAQHVSLYAASFGVAKPGQLPKIADWLVSDTANTVRMSANAVQWLLDALYAGGQVDAALDVWTVDHHRPAPARPAGGGARQR